MKPDRIFYFDAMRSVLMMLGVVFHSAQVYNPDANWLISSPQGLEIASYIASVLHSFRMPAFFAVAGFFCAVTLGRQDELQYVRTRMQRLLFPMISTALTLNVLQTYLLNRHRPNAVSVADFALNGGWVSHLWFLINLILYFLLAAAFVYAYRRMGSVWAVSLLKRIGQIPFWVALLLLPGFWLFARAIGKAGVPIHANFFGFIHVSSLIYYLPYFLFGVALRLSDEIREKMESLSPLIPIAIAGICVFLLESIEFNGGLTGLALVTGLTELIQWCGVMLCFHFFRTFFSKPNRTWYYLSDASYTVYLFHHVLVVGFGILFMRVGIPPLIEMLAIIMIVLAITLSIHHFAIRRFGALRLLFNGKRY